MGKRKRVKPDEVQKIKNIRLGWEARRQVQQELLQRKLVQCFLEPTGMDSLHTRYPEAMQPLIEDFVRKAEKQTSSYSR
jgi:hypothetical protein